MKHRPNTRIKKKINWDVVGPIIAGVLAVGFWGGLIIWLQLEESGGLSGLFQDKEKVLYHILSLLAKLV